MKVYAVGGSVRDELMGSPVHDYDFVVTGATPAEMLDQGYSQVGADFPVFLHPHTGDQYALARIERKVGPGYHGFTVNADVTVTIEQDLSRRDLTINSIARDLTTKELIDPFNGVADIQHRILRHTSDAFSEDPVRVLRLARFAARFPTFVISPKTINLCCEMVANGDLNDLTQERVWLEVTKAIEDGNSCIFFETLIRFDALRRVPALRAFKSLSQEEIENTVILLKGAPVDVVLGTLLHKAEVVLSDRETMGLPANTLKVAHILSFAWSDFSNPTVVYDRFVKSGALRNLDVVCQALASKTHYSVIYIRELVKLCLKVKAEHFPDLTGKALGDAIRDARIAAISKEL